MIPKKISGKAFVVGDDINTDLIIPARYQTTMDPEKLALHALEDLDPRYYSSRFIGPDGISEYSIIVAGKNFGCGSSREHAPIALHAAGARAVIAKSFARIYFRNSINGDRSILPVESYDDLKGEIKTGDELEIDTDNYSITDLTTGKKYRFRPLSQFAKDILEAGGLTAYNKRRLLL